MDGDRHPSRQAARHLSGGGKTAFIRAALA